MRLKKEPFFQAHKHFPDLTNFKIVGDGYMMSIGRVVISHQV